MTDHDHDFGLPDSYADPDGRPVDNQLLARFIGAAFDGCTSCQDPLLTLMVQDAPTTSRLVELACIATHTALGGLPRGMLDRRAPGLTSQAFRTLARAGLDGENDAMFRACEQMTVPRRREAANDAADILVGHLAAGT